MVRHGADPLTYLNPLLDEMAKKWPDNRVINIVCHGHSVPAGYFATPFVNSFCAYPHLLHRLIKERFPYAVVNVIVTAIGGENSKSGSLRFEKDVLTHRPDLVTIDYALNDRALDLSEAKNAWRNMIEAALHAAVPVILLTGTLDRSYFDKGPQYTKLTERAELIRGLADEYNVGLADSLSAWTDAANEPEALVNLLSHVNHPTSEGHMLVARELGKFFTAR